MNDQDPPGFPPLKSKTTTTKSDRPVRRDSLTKPGVPPGAPLSAERSGSCKDPASTEEMALEYIYSLPAEAPLEKVLLDLISEHLKAPFLERQNPDSISEAQARTGFRVLVPGSSCLTLGDTVILFWGSKSYPEHKVHEDTLNEPIVCTQWIMYSVYDVVPQGKVAVCYDVYRDGQRIGTSPILSVNLHSCYASSQKQRRRSRSVRRKKPHGDSRK